MVDGCVDVEERKEFSFNVKIHKLFVFKVGRNNQEKKEQLDLKSEELKLELQVCSEEVEDDKMERLNLNSNGSPLSSSSSSSSSSTSSSSTSSSSSASSSCVKVEEKKLTLVSVDVCHFRFNVNLTLPRVSRRMEFARFDLVALNRNSEGGSGGDGGHGGGELRRRRRVDGGYDGSKSSGNVSDDDGVRWRIRETENLESDESKDEPLFLTNFKKIVDQNLEDETKETKDAQFLLKNHKKTMQMKDTADEETIKSSWDRKEGDEPSLSSSSFSSSSSLPSTHPKTVKSRVRKVRSPEIRSSIPSPNIPSNGLRLWTKSFELTEYSASRSGECFRVPASASAAAIGLPIFFLLLCFCLFIGWKIFSPFLIRDWRSKKRTGRRGSG